MDFAHHPLGTLDHQSPIPLHHQLTQVLRKNILNGDLVDGDGRVPTELELSKQFAVSRITVRTAIETLVDEGLLWRKRGSGTFVKTNWVEHWVGQLMGFSETLKDAGFEPTGKVLHRGLAPTTKFPDLPDAVDTEQLWEFQRIRYADGQPIALEESLFAKEIGLAMEQEVDLDNIYTYLFIENVLRIPLSEATQLITAVNATPEDAEMLHVHEQDALLYIERLTKSHDGQFVELLRARYRPDYFTYTIHLTRPRRI